jgi:hypothetical protein
MWASPYCTQSLFLWFNSAQSENHISIVWSSVQLKVHVNHWMFKTKYKFIQQCCVLYTMRHTPQRDYGLLTLKGYSLIIMENVRNQQHQASGMVRAEEKAKSRYTVTVLSLLYTQTNQQPNNLSQVGRGDTHTHTHTHQQTERWLAVLI